MSLELPIYALLIAGIATLLILGYVVLSLKEKRGQDTDPVNSGQLSSTSGNNTEVEEIPFSCSKIDALKESIFSLAFGPLSADWVISDEHARVVNSVAGEMEKAVREKKYFPRRPQLLPQLLRAIRSDESGTKELVDIVVQDPVLTASVLKLANSTFYRISEKPVTTIGEAIVLLGFDGLKSLVASSIMQPVFQVPKGLFENFSETYWIQSLNSAQGAQVYARVSKSCDSFTAHLLGLVINMSYIVMFRLTADIYSRFPGTEPRAEVFVHIMEEHVGEVAALITSDWEFGDEIPRALRENIDRLEISSMSNLARALFYGRVIGVAALLCQRGLWEEEKAIELLASKGLDPDFSDAVWQKMMSV